MTVAPVILTYRTPDGREASVHLQRLVVEVYSLTYRKHRFGSLDEMHRWLAAHRFRAAEATA